MLVNGSDENISEVVGPAEMLVNGLAEILVSGPPENVPQNCLLCTFVFENREFCHIFMSYA